MDGDTHCGHLPGFIPSVSSVLLLLPAKSWKVREAHLFGADLSCRLYCDIPPPARLPIFSRQVLSQRPAMYPGEMGIYQDQMPLYINCTEVTHIYTNGSYQLVYQNCTPVFVNTKQVLNYLDLLAQVALYGSNEQTKVPASSPESQI